ncbi:unnamed protein product [Parnassius apollo]|uniref:(apollo) hypothetical protein n=1 Tax=Parnassius apollo TaxID=110799 RepID=A0A8S3XRQ2_PARAO|nr:unnamed protein product [Parnassius apollo]
MSSNRRREFSLRQDEIIEFLMADYSDDEEGLVLDEEDQTFLEQDVDTGISIVEIEPGSASPEENIIENQQPSSNVLYFNWRKNSYSPHNFCEMEGYNFGEVHIFDQTSDTELNPVKIFNAATAFEKLVEEIIFHESIRYAHQNGRSFTLTAEEAKAFFGMNFVMGYHCLPTFRHGSSLYC